VNLSKPSMRLFIWVKSSPSWEV